MTPQQIVGLAARLLAVWLALTSLSYFIFAISMAVTQDSRSVSGQDIFLARHLVMAVLHLGGALALWFFPMTIAHKLIPRTKFQDTLRLPARQAVAAACVILGLVVIVLNALPSVSSYLALAAFYIAHGEQLSTMTASQHTNGLAALIQLAAGLFLIVKAHTLTARFMPSPDADDASAPVETPQDAPSAAP